MNRVEMISVGSMLFLCGVSLGWALSNWRISRYLKKEIAATKLLIADRERALEAALFRGPHNGKDFNHE